ncbi:hypothetical protein FE62_15435, partial [Staphylococcus aureus]
DPLHQRAGGVSGRRHQCRWHRSRTESQAGRRGPARGREGVPELQPVPASDRAGELHLGTDLGAQCSAEGSRGDRDEVPGTGQDPAPGAE